MPKFLHIPVLVAEVMEALRPRDGGWYCDLTAGGGGHLEAILRASGPGGRAFGCDRDGNAIEATRERLKEFGDRLHLQRGNYCDLLEWVQPGSFDGVLLDLGVSSHQLDEPSRGFSFQKDGPLDMRADDRQFLTAAAVVNTMDPEELARIFWELGDERESRRYARAIAAERTLRPFQTTLQLAGLIERLSPRRGNKTHPATQVFQALRIYVNDEMGSLRKGLDAAVKALKPAGVLAIITFHSLEDRLVKEFGRERSRDYTVDSPVDIPELRKPCVPELIWTHRKAIKPSENEARTNPRSRSAQLRVFKKM